MAEAKPDSVQKSLPTYSYGETKPGVPEGAGVDYIPEFHHQKRDQIVGWRRVSTTPHSDSEGFFVPPEHGGPDMPTFSQRTLDEARNNQRNKKED